MLLQQEDKKLKETAQEIGESFNPIIDKLTDWKNDSYEMLPNMVAAFITLLLFAFIARLAKRFIRDYLGKFVTNKAANNIIANIIFALILIFGFMIALNIMNLDKAVTGFLAGAGVVGLALGFAFQDTAANFISGTFMAFRKNFRVGDLVETNGITAIVDHIDLRSTKFKTLDGYEITMPNKEIFQHKLTNYNRYSTRRIELTVGVGYESDLTLVQQVALKAINEIEEIKEVPSPQFFYTEFGDSSINFEVRFWIDFLGVPDYLEARHLAIKNIKTHFDRNHINIPFPIRTLDFGKNNLTTIQKTPNSPE